MSAHTDPQIIMHDGKPAFAIIPWEEYQELIRQNTPDDSAVWIPHEVVRASVIDGVSLIRAWREYYGLTQKVLAHRAGMTQPALARLEKADARPRTATLKKLAAALNITVDQITE